MVAVHTAAENPVVVRDFPALTRDDGRLAADHVQNRRHGELDIDNAEHNELLRSLKGFTIPISKRVRIHVSIAAPVRSPSAR
jgi:hypothetical protein